MFNKFKVHTFNRNLSVTQVLLLRDNYSYILHDKTDGVTVVVDPSVADPLLQILDRYGMKVSYILCTHHHYDHIGGNADIVKAFTSCKVLAPFGTEHKIPNVNLFLSDGQDIKLSTNIRISVMHTPGHTLESSCYIINGKTPIAFVGDTLFSFGCGRIFEGTIEQMYQSMAKLKSLSHNTVFFCGHEYSVQNLEFAKSVSPDNKDLSEFLQEIKLRNSEDKFIVPTILSQELRFNPFLNTNSPTDFRLMREAKDEF